MSGVRSNGCMLPFGRFEIDLVAMNMDERRTGDGLKVEMLKQMLAFGPEDLKGVVTQ